MALYSKFDRMTAQEVKDYLHGLTDRIKDFFNISDNVCGICYDNKHHHTIDVTFRNGFEVRIWTADGEYRIKDFDHYLTFAGSRVGPNLYGLLYKGKTTDMELYFDNTCPAMDKNMETYTNDDDLMAKLAQINAISVKYNRTTLEYIIGHNLSGDLCKFPQKILTTLDDYIEMIRPSPLDYIDVQLPSNFFDSHGLCSQHSELGFRLAIYEIIAKCIMEGTL